MESNPYTQLGKRTRSQRSLFVVKLALIDINSIKRLHPACKTNSVALQTVERSTASGNELYQAIWAAHVA